MNDKQFASLLTLLMCSDPWPTSPSEEEILKSMANAMAVERGFTDWVEAYHKLWRPNAMFRRPP